MNIRRGISHILSIQNQMILHLTIPILLWSSHVICDQLSESPINEALLNKEEDHWRQNAISKLWDERVKIGHTPIVRFPLKGFPNADIFFKNETATPTKTLKHRFAWALIMWAVLEGKIRSNTTVYDSTSGNTGASEAYMCTAIDVPFVAVVAKDLEAAKVKQIESFGGQLMKVDVSLRNFHAKDQAEKKNGFFINQFGNADRAEESHESGDFKHESSNVFHEILDQLEKDPTQKKKVPDYFVHSAGTGGTISSVGRYVDRYNLPTRVVLADSQYSLFYDFVINHKFTNESGNKLWRKPGIAGIGYGYDVKPVLFGETTSLVRSVVDEAVKMPDIATVAALHVLRSRGVDGGPSTALNFLVSMYKAFENRNDKSSRTTIVTLINDPASFYENNYFNEEWIGQIFADRGGLTAFKCWKNVIIDGMDKGTDFLKIGMDSCRPKRFTRSAAIY